MIFCPSIIKLRFFSDSALNLNSTSTSGGKTRGLEVRECGEIGVTIIEKTSGWTIGPPEDKEYAVDPVGVLIIIPSDL
jgi:hypothetical protein